MNCKKLATITISKPEDNSGIAFGFKGHGDDIDISDLLELIEYTCQIIKSTVVCNTSDDIVMRTRLNQFTGEAFNKVKAGFSSGILEDFT